MGPILNLHWPILILHWPILNLHLRQFDSEDVKALNEGHPDWWGGGKQRKLSGTYIIKKDIANRFYIHRNGFFSVNVIMTSIEKGQEK